MKVLVRHSTHPKKIFITTNNNDKYMKQNKVETNTIDKMKTRITNNNLLVTKADKSNANVIIKNNKLRKYNRI